MSLRIEQNWKWSNKTFPHTLCVVSTSDETTHCGICLTSNKNLHWASGVGGLGQKLYFLRTTQIRAVLTTKFKKMAMVFKRRRRDLILYAKQQ